MNEHRLQGAWSAIVEGVARLAALAGTSWTPPVSVSESGRAASDLAASLLCPTAPDPAAEPWPQLRSVFADLPGASNQLYWPLSVLNPQQRDQFMPGPKAEASERQRAYVNLWKEFTVDTHAWSKASTVTVSLLETYLNALFRCAWCVPGPNGQGALYEHTRLIAALASCAEASDPPATIDQTSTTLEWVLIGGDISGLQKFIYTLASSGAAKSLRARSFYLQLLTEAIVQYVLDGLDLPMSSSLYTGGGRFQIMAPRSATVRLPPIRTALIDQLLQLHQGALGLHLEWVSASSSDLNRFAQLRDRLGGQIAMSKRRPFAAATSTVLAENIGVPMFEGGHPDRFCRVTGEDGAENLGTDADGVLKSHFVLSLEDLGRRLPRATHVVFAPIDPQPVTHAQSWETALRALGVSVQLVAEGELAVPITGTIQTGTTRIWRLSPVRPDDEDRRLAALGQNRVTTYRPFAKLTPAKDHQVATFDDLVVPLRGAFERWGVLRMDVDNAGDLFGAGPATGVGPTWVASLSLAMRLFFEGWLPQLAEPDLLNHVYIQYSGGDDVFVVGSWDALALFADRIHAAWHEYVCRNTRVTLSAGIALVPRGFPLYQAAHLAGEAEAAAKTYVRPRESNDHATQPVADGNAPAARTKDAAAFVGEVVGWDEFSRARELAYRLADAVEAQSLPRTVLQTIMGLYAKVGEAQREQLVRQIRLKQSGKPARLQYGRWTWMAAYSLHRHTAGPRVPQDARDLIRQQVQPAFVGPADSPQLRIVGLAARWAQLLIRGVS